MMNKHDWYLRNMRTVKAKTVSAQKAEEDYWRSKAGSMIAYVDHFNGCAKVSIHILFFICLLEA